MSNVFEFLLPDPLDPEEPDADPDELEPEPDELEPDDDELEPELDDELELEEGFLMVLTLGAAGSTWVPLQPRR
jgi:hypothetical protein